MHEALPRRPGLDLLTLAVDEVPVEFTTAGVDIHLCGAKPSLLLPEIASNPEGSDDERGEVGLEEIGCGSSFAGDTDGGDGSVELS